VTGEIMYSRLNRIRKREIQTEPIEAFLPRIRSESSKKWSIRIPVPPGTAGEHWGDLYFAKDLAVSLSNLDQEVQIHRRNLLWSMYGDEDVCLVIRGLERINPKPNCINVLWIISTPELITRDELESFDIVFAASEVWASRTTARTGVEVLPLLQCTNPERFNPKVSKSDLNEDIVFVGNSRKKLRKVIQDALLANVTVSIFGKSWTGRVPDSWIKGDFVSNSSLPTLYRSSAVVLNDHRPDMAREGFYSNRLFDAVASGGRVISDHVDGIAELFDGGVQTYSSPTELAMLCDTENRGLWGTQEEITERAERIGRQHSFDQRAKSMIEAVQSLI